MNKTARSHASIHHCVKQEFCKVHVQIKRCGIAWTSYKGNREYCTNLLLSKKHIFVTLNSAGSTYRPTQGAVEANFEINKFSVQVIPYN